MPQKKPKKDNPESNRVLAFICLPYSIGFFIYGMHIIHRKIYIAGPMLLNRRAWWWWGTPRSSGGSLVGHGAVLLGYFLCGLSVFMFILACVAWWSYRRWKLSQESDGL